MGGLRRWRGPLVLAVGLSRRAAGVLRAPRLLEVDERAVGIAAQLKQKPAELRLHDGPGLLRSGSRSWSASARSWPSSSGKPTPSRVKKIALERKFLQKVCYCPIDPHTGRRRAPSSHHHDGGGGARANPHLPVYYGCCETTDAGGLRTVGLLM